MKLEDMNSLADALQWALHRLETAGVECGAYFEKADGIWAAAQEWRAVEEATAFEDWARCKGYNLETHPLHWLFLDAKTYAARQGWKAALSYVGMLGAKDWSVVNSGGAVVASGLTLKEADNYLTDERLERGWSAVCVVNKDNRVTA